MRTTLHSHTEVNLRLQTFSTFGQPTKRPASAHQGLKPVSIITGERLALIKLNQPRVSPSSCYRENLSINTGEKRNAVVDVKDN